MGSERAASAATPNAVAMGGPAAPISEREQELRDVEESVREDRGRCL